MLKPPPVLDDVEYLIGLTPAEFRDVVLDNVRPDAPERMWIALCHPDVVLATSDVLRDRFEHIVNEIQITKSDPFAHGRYRRAVAEQQSLQRRLAQARDGRRIVHEIDRDAKVNHYANLVGQLARAVNGHRLACIAADLAAEPHDVVLWDQLDQLRLFETPNTPAAWTLAEALRNGWAADRADASKESQ